MSIFKNVIIKYDIIFYLMCLMFIPGCIVNVCPSSDCNGAISSGNDLKINYSIIRL